jgi:3-deoxy-D-manno-octulosonate 8-phosphate phosphatase (KDO 8-P phosphatase)
VREPEAGILAKASRVAMIVLDADGVLTDGAIVVLADGGEARNFHSRDGLGIKLGQKAGLKFAIVSGRTSRTVEARGRELGFVAVEQGVADKAACLTRLAEREGVALEAICFMGDDLVDLPALRLAGFAAAPADADPHVTGAVDWVASARGGRGAVREVIDLVLKARGAWDHVTAAYFGGR